MTEQAKPVQNIKRANVVMKMNLDDEERKGSADKLNEYLERLSRVPPPARHFLGALAMRAQRMRDTRAVSIPRFGDTKILISDLRGAFKLSRDGVVEQAKELESYGLGGLEPMNTDNGDEPAVYISRWDGWNIMDLIARFCIQESVPIEKFTDELDFTPLDEPDKR